MTKFTLSLAAATAMLFASPQAPEAEAQGIHFGLGRLHVDVGNPHRGFHSNYGRVYQPRRYARSVIYGDYGHGGFGHGRRTARYHDTSHFDYIPGHYVPHGNHFDYIPGRTVFHREGHWDYGRHGRRHHH